VEEKASRQRRQQEEDAKEKLHLDITAEREEMIAKADSKALREHHQAEKRAHEQEAARRREMHRIEDAAEAKRIRQSLSEMAKKDKSKENQEFSNMRLKVVNDTMETHGQTYRSMVANPQRSRSRLENARLDQDMADRDKAAGAFFDNREDTRHRQMMEVGRTLGDQIEEKRKLAMKQAARKAVEKQVVDSQVYAAMEADMRKHFADKEKEIRYQQELAKAMAEKVARQEGEGFQAGSAVATMHVSPELSHNLSASKLLEKPMGRPLGVPAPWATRSHGSGGVPNLQEEYRRVPLAHQTPAEIAKALQKAKSSPALHGGRLGATRGRAAPSHMDPLKSSWLRSLSPEAKKAAMEAAKAREAAALEQVRGW
jgi:hypothetical protein